MLLCIPGSSGRADGLGSDPGRLPVPAMILWERGIGMPPGTFDDDVRVCRRPPWPWPWATGAMLGWMLCCCWRCWDDGVVVALEMAGRVWARWVCVWGLVCWLTMPREEDWSWDETAKGFINEKLLKWGGRGGSWGGWDCSDNDEVASCSRSPLGRTLPLPPPIDIKEDRDVGFGRKLEREVKGLDGALWLDTERLPATGGRTTEPRFLAVDWLLRPVEPDRWVPRSGNTLSLMPLSEMLWSRDEGKSWEGGRFSSLLPAVCDWFEVRLSECAREKLEGAWATSGKSGVGSEGRATSLMEVGSAASWLDTFCFSSLLSSVELSAIDEKQEYYTTCWSM